MKFDYARDALRYLIKEFSIKEIYIPYYICNVVRHAVFEAGAKPKFYHIDDNFYPTIEKVVKEDVPAFWTPSFL